MKKIILVFCTLLLVACTKPGVDPLDPPVAKITVMISSGSNGTVIPVGKQVLTKDQSLYLTITPNSGYTYTVTVDGQIVTDMSLIGSIINANPSIIHTIEVTFPTIVMYTIEAIPGLNGRITPLGISNIPSGSNLPLTIIPAVGFEVDVVKIDGVVTTVTGLTYTFSNVTANHKIEVTFRKSAGYFLTEFKGFVEDSAYVKNSDGTWSKYVVDPADSIVFYKDTRMETFRNKARISNGNWTTYIKDGIQYIDLGPGAGGSPWQVIILDEKKLKFMLSTQDGILVLTHH